MEMCYNGALVMPNNFVAVTEDEMEYIEGGMSGWQKAGIIAIAVAAGVGLTVALAYGQLWLAAKIMGYAMKKYVVKLGVKAVATVVAGSLGISAAAVTGAIKYTLSL